MDSVTEASINPGIRRLVKILNDRGFQTTDSGDGETNVNAGVEGAQPWPHVVIQSHESMLTHEAYRLKRLMNEYGVALVPMTDDLMMPCIQASFDPLDGTAVILLYGVTDALLKR